MTRFTRSGALLVEQGTFDHRDESRTLTAASKVAIYLDSLQGYGADRTLIKITNSLANRGIAVDLILAKQAKQAPQQIHPAIRMVNLGSSRGNVIKNVFGLTRYLIANQPDVLFSSIHFNNVTATASLALAQSIANVRSKLIVRQANTLRHQLKSYPFPIGSALGFCTRLAYKKADVIISQSKGMTNDLTNFMNADPQKVRLIYNPTVTPDIFELAQQPTGHPWFDHRTAPIVLAAGRLKAQKDFTSLIRAFAQVKRQIPDARLVLLGEGPQRKLLEDLAAELGIANSIALPGFQKNPYAFISMADVFVLSSQYEGLPNILIEALALGKRIVATDCESGPAEILQHGKYGMLVPVGDFTQMADAIVQSLQEPFACLNQPQAIADFQQDTQVEKYVDVFYADSTQQGKSFKGKSSQWVVKAPNPSKP